MFYFLAFVKLSNCCVKTMVHGLVSAMYEPHTVSCKINQQDVNSSGLYSEQLVVMFRICCNYMTGLSLIIVWYYYFLIGKIYWI